MLNRSIVHISMAALLLFASLLLALALAPAVGAQSPPGSFSEEEAQAIDRMIMCPVCPAETIDQAQVEVSFQMRALVRQLLAEGRSRDEILEYFADRYGADILAAPPKSGANLLVWILPIVGVAAGLAGVYLVVRAMTNRAQPAAAGAMTGPAADPATDPGLRPYLQIVDRSLASRRAARTPSGQARHRSAGKSDGRAGRTGLEWATSAQSACGSPWPWPATPRWGRLRASCGVRRRWSRARRRRCTPPWSCSWWLPSAWLSCSSTATSRSPTWPSTATWPCPTATPG